MLARLRILLPFELAVPTDVRLKTYELATDDHRLRLHAPYRAKLRHDLLQLGRQHSIAPREAFQPADDATTEDITIGGKPTELANTLVVDIFDADFLDRAEGAGEREVELGFAAANAFLSAVRTLARAPHVRQVQPQTTVWHLDYLDDDIGRLESEEGLVQGRGGVSTHLQLFTVQAELWEAAVELASGGFEPSPWDTLLLDAVDLVPQGGPALALAYTAIETRAFTAADLLAAESSVGQQLWSWARERSEDYSKDSPSVGEVLDPVLQALGGKSLKDDDPDLWKSFTELRRARNSFIHEGTPRISKRKRERTDRRQEVDRDKTAELVGQASSVVRWIESLLPEQERTPTYERGPDKVSAVLMRL